MPIVFNYSETTIHLSTERRPARSMLLVSVGSMNWVTTTLQSITNWTSRTKLLIVSVGIKLSHQGRFNGPRWGDFPANISTSDQRCFNVVDQRWNNVDPTLKMKQNPTSDFQRRTTLIQRRCPTLKQRWNNVETTLHNVGTMLIQRSLHLASTLIKIILNPIGLVMIMDLPIH